MQNYRNVPVKEKVVTVVFRMDDYSAVSSTDAEIHIIALFRKHRAAITLGVIPSVCARDIADPAKQPLLSLPEEKTRILRAGIEDGTVDVALHGYSHQTISTNTKAEFKGLAYDEQLEKLARGQIVLEKAIGYSAKTFIPPWNLYDLNTIHALDKQKFSVISAGWNGPAAPQTNLHFLPATASITNIKSAVESGRRSQDIQPIIVALFHLYDFVEIGMERGLITLLEFADLLDWIEKQPNVRVLSIAQAVDCIDDLSANRFLSVKAWRAVQAATPLGMREKIPVLLYHEKKLYRTALWKLTGFYVLFAVGFLIWATTALQLYLSHSDIGRLLAAFGFLTLGISIAYAFARLKVTPGSIVTAARLVKDSFGRPRDLSGC